MVVAVEHHVNDFHRLCLHVLWRTAVLDYKVGFVAFLLNWHLRLNAFFGF